MNFYTFAMTIFSYIDQDTEAQPSSLQTRMKPRAAERER